MCGNEYIVAESLYFVNMNLWKRIGGLLAALFNPDDKPPRRQKALSPFLKFS